MVAGIGPETSDLSTQVLQSVQTLVQPVRLQRLTIQPISLLVSIHASLKLYIASDHTPLSFSLFERGPVCTTARQLVHALAMHYAAGALFRAGTCCTQGLTHNFVILKSLLFILNELVFRALTQGRCRVSCRIFHHFNFFFHYIIFDINIHYREGDLQSRRLPFVCNQAGMCAQVRNLFSLSPVLRVEMITARGSRRFVPQREVKSCSCKKQNFKTQFSCFFVIIYCWIGRLGR